jgi:hypothetical protein
MKELKERSHMLSVAFTIFWWVLVDDAGGVDRAVIVWEAHTP